MNTQVESIEDVEKVVLAGEIIRAHGPWLVAIGDENLAFSKYPVNAPVLTGAQVLDIAGVDEPVEYAVFRMLESGLLEGLRPDEATDIRSARVVRFLVFRTDRTFRLQLGDRLTEWGVRFISGHTLRALADHDDPDIEVWQDVRDGGPDRKIEPHDLVDLAEEGVERFYFRSMQYHLVVNGGPKTVNHRKASYWEIVLLAFPDAVPAKNIIYTVDYGKGPAENPNGSLAEGQHVFVKNGMTFYVTPTDKS